MIQAKVTNKQQTEGKEMIEQYKLSQKTFDGWYRKADKILNASIAPEKIIDSITLNALTTNMWCFDSYVKHSRYKSQGETLEKIIKYTKELEEDFSSEIEKSKGLAQFFTELKEFTKKLQGDVKHHESKSGKCTNT